MCHRHMVWSIKDTIGRGLHLLLVLVMHDIHPGNVSLVVT